MIDAAPIEPAAATCYFASDFHLDGSARGESGLRRLLAAALRGRAELFILGDLFHYWFGRQHLQMPMYRRELALLRRATGAGVRVSLLPGNRDFLVEGAFERATGVRVLPDYQELRLGAERVHLSHGDLFCTRDIGYRRLRRVLRSKMVVFSAHHLPSWIVHPIAKMLRRQSQRSVGAKKKADLEPNLEAVESLFARGFGVVVCGHFHRLRFEDGAPEAGRGRFLILEPYEERGYVLTWQQGEWRQMRLAGEDLE
ncbi:MAG: UDP-2,3-diacylglucosamine diphosphatase [Planctomycetes bacterium]|nr:UDP-2,3-diacylglucosamine diphosphatase [Planctomycetota bacterium]